MLDAFLDGNGFTKERAGGQNRLVWPSGKPLVGLSCPSCIRRAVSNRQQHLKTAHSGPLEGGTHEGNRPKMYLDLVDARNHAPRDHFYPSSATEISGAMPRRSFFMALWRSSLDVARTAA